LEGVGDGAGPGRLARVGAEAIGKGRRPATIDGGFCLTTSVQYL